MKIKFVVLTLLCLIPQAALCSNQLEKLALCIQDNDVIDVVVQMRDENGFNKDGRYFYVPVAQEEAFGFEVKYSGVTGVDMIPGPNITVAGPFQVVIDNVKSQHNGQFECQPEGCASEISDELVILVYPHPNIDNHTIVQCGLRGVR